MQKTTIKETQELTAQDEAAIVTELNKLWTTGYDAMGDARKRRKRVINAYNCRHEADMLRKNGSKAYLPWIYSAIEAITPRLVSVLLPNDEDSFNAEGETEEDKQGVETLTKYLKSHFRKIRYRDKMALAVKQLMFGDVGLKCYWDEVKKEKTERVVSQEQVPIIDEFGQPVIGLDGQPMVETQIKSTSVKKLIPFKMGVDFEVISSDDLAVYPLHGNIERSMKAHRFWRHKDELEESGADGYYKNIDKLEDVKKDFGTPDEKRSDKHGHEIKEYWLPRLKANGIVYYNSVAVVADDKVLLRFAPNPYDFGVSPIIYCPLSSNIESDGAISHCGVGITDRAIEIQKIANFMVNQMIDEYKIKVHGSYKWFDDDVFNPEKFVSRPGGLIQVNKEHINTNLVPLNPNIGQLSFAITELQYLRAEFDMATGVPHSYKGAAEYAADATATQKRLEAESSDIKFRSIAAHINNMLLEPWIKFSYLVTRQMAAEHTDVLMDIANVTQPRFVEYEGQRIEKGELEMLVSVPDIPSLDSVDIKVKAYENVLSKGEKIQGRQSLMEWINGVHPFDPRVKYLPKVEEMTRSYALDLSLDDGELRTTQEIDEQMQQDMIEAQQQMQQQAMMGIVPNGR